MPSGIKIKCKKKFGQFLLTERPYCIINDVETVQLSWDEEIFIPLQPNLPYKITIQIPYAPMKNPVGITSIVTQVKHDEVQEYEYTTPFIATSSGKIKRKS